MSGHSRWSTIKRKKAKEDAKKGKIFSKLTRAIVVAARAGGGSPETNIALTTAIERAKEYNLPHDNIERAIKKGTGETEGVTYENIIYEGYAPYGVAVMVDVLTDNRNRAASDIRNIFSKYNGNLGESGCVSWIFNKQGIILIGKKNTVKEDELLSVVLEAGGEDLRVEDGIYEIITSQADFNNVKKMVEDKGFEIESAQITMVPKNTVKLKKEEAKKVLKLVNILEEHDDIQEVYSNFDIEENVLEEIEAED
ncbi:MAG: YebC/PmpR family DNA-binding transcriptional regulator [Actinomycetia bacterium]|nr:YebC/PmpR family DNA-binding transcriptional regulator [Actinomycetes bacterium]